MPTARSPSSPARSITAKGHASAFAQVLVEKLGVPFDRIRLVQGDSDQLVTGGGTGGSRSAMLSGTAIAQASDKVIEQGKQIAAHVLEASAGDIEFKSGRFTIAGTDRSIGIMELAERLRAGIKLPDGVPADARRDACHRCRARHLSQRRSCRRSGNRPRYRPDPRGEIHRGQRFRHRLNPMLVEGQVQGGAVQGLGQVLLEGAVYDADGQLVTGSFMDYAMPRAHDVPMIDVANRPVPTKTNPVGAKGCGEAGTSGGLPAVANAVIDALSDYGIRHMEMPMTPARIWQAIQDAKRAQS